MVVKRHDRIKVIGQVAQDDHALRELEGVSPDEAWISDVTSVTARVGELLVCPNKNAASS